MNIKRWITQTPDTALVQTLQEGTGLPKIVCEILASRNMSVSQAQDFLSSDLTFESPHRLIDMDKAVQRIHTALFSNEKICIYGDYDCDGITSTAMLMTYFRALGGDVFYYIPKRQGEGYGLNNEALDEIHRAGATLLITVDNGISAHDEVDYAKTLGIDVVITDHHTPRETLPAAIAVVNPHRKDCPSVFKDYAGVGVAFQLVCALEEADALEMLEVYGDLVTIGTIADIVPLVGENRSIVRFGLEAIRHSVRPGIHALFTIGGISTDQPLTSDSIAFGFAPRINAAGRMGHVEDAVELLITDDFEYAMKLADNLQEYNQQRRRTEDEILSQVEESIAQRPEILNNRVLVVSGEAWHPGVLGIVASRLMDQYGKPCLVFSVQEGMASGSGRSLEGFDLISAVDACSEHLTHYGGHTLAAGATVPVEYLDDFDQKLQAYAAQHYRIMPVPTIYTATTLDGSQLLLDTVFSMDILGPFGAGNEAPLFALVDVVVEGLYPTRDGNHMRLRLSAQGQPFTAIYFRMEERQFPYKEGDIVDCIVGLEVNHWNGQQQLSVRIEDLRSAHLPQDEIIQQGELYQRYARGELQGSEPQALLPDREELELVYRYIRHQKSFTYGPTALYEVLRDYDISYGKIRIAIDAFEELGLFTIEQDEIALAPDIEPVDLNDSSILQSLQS